MDSAKNIGFGIVGTGMVAEFHHTAILANQAHGARLVAMCSRDPKKSTAEKFDAPCLNWDDFVNHPKIDVVCVCTPSGLHADQAVEAAQAGKHALVEKPLALSMADADRMIEAFDRAGRLLAVALQRRAEPLFQQIGQAIHGGDLGRLTLGLATMPYWRGQAYFDSDQWRGTWALDGGGVLMNQGIHILDLLVWYMGDPVHVKSFAATLQRDIEVEDTVAAALRFASGSMATVTATTTASPGFPHRLEIYGTQGGIQVQGESVIQWSLNDPASATVAPPQVGETRGAGAGADPRAIAATGHINLIRNMMDTIRGETSLLVDGREGRRSLDIVLKIYRAAGLVR